MNHPRFVLTIGAILAVVFMAAAAYAGRPSPETNPTRATVETVGAIAGVDGWCDSGVTPFTYTDMASTKPARLSAAVMSKVRFVTLTYKPGANGGTDNRACIVVGNQTGVVAGDVGCSNVGGDDTGAIMWGGTMPLAIARDLDTGLLPPILWSSIDEDAIMCITIGF